MGGRFEGAFWRLSGSAGDDDGDGAGDDGNDHFISCLQMYECKL